MRKLILLFLCLFTHGWLHAQCPPGQVEMGLTVNMGGFPTEHYWKLKNDWFVNGQYFSTTIDSTVAFTYTSMNTTYGPNSFPQHKQCLYEDTLYRFEAWDTFGDGWNGGTYSWERLCDGQVRADNGGMSPGNLSCWVTPCIQAWEYFSPDQCTQHNLWVSQVIESDTALCEGYVYVDVELSNLGVVPADSFLVNVELGPDTQSILVTTPLNFSQSTTITLGPFVPVGSTGGNTYTPKAWTTYPPDTINNNDTLTGNPVTSFANSPFVQTDVQLPPLPPDTNGTVTTGVVLLRFQLHGTHFLLSAGPGQHRHLAWPLSGQHQNHAHFPLGNRIGADGFGICTFHTGHLQSTVYPNRHQYSSGPIGRDSSWGLFT